MLKKSVVLCLLSTLALPVLAQTQNSEAASAVKASEAAQSVSASMPASTPAPAPAPAAVSVPPAPPKRCDFSVTLQSDDSFDNKKGMLKDAAKQRLDNEALAKMANCAKVDLIVVTGHSDLSGKPQALQKLSEKQADTVAAYLTSKGVSATIETMGMGKTQQIKACDEKLPKAQLAECLAPNRRVVIEARGLAK